MTVSDYHDDPRQDKAPSQCFHCGRKEEQVETGIAFCQWCSEPTCNRCGTERHSEVICWECVDGK